jgi:hypothetical protein
LKVEFDEQCQSCKGTGLYVGMAERDGAAVVCHTCKGTGCHHFVHEYEPFTIRHRRGAVKRVLEANPGIGIGEGQGYKLTDFGGMEYEDWLTGKPFPGGSEMRRFVCPAWFYQSANSKLKPDWKQCGYGMFNACVHFGDKAQCWARFDKEKGESTT